VPQSRVVRYWIAALTFAAVLPARDDERLALSLKAQSDFERVALAPMPSLPETAACAQSVSAILSVSSPEEFVSLHYRKGYCLLAEATVTGSGHDFAAAAGELDKAIESWPLRIRKPSRDARPEPVPAGLRALAALAHLHAEGEATGRPLLEAATAGATCSTGTPALMGEDSCRFWVQTARLWLGRIALREGRLGDAESDFTAMGETGWLDWSRGQIAFQAGNYPQAVARYTSAIQTWKAVWNDPGPAFARRLGPRPNLGSVLADLGGAQLLTGNPAAAIVTLDTSLKLDPASARAFYLRARARELAGRSADAMTDYNLATRAAFAAAENLASGEAHLYRGILLFRRKDYSRGEDEFASALNFSIAGGLKADAEAWRYLAAVASGSCAAARQNLEQTLPAVSPFFPKDEARALAGACQSTAN
jgi:tetratricopeptide (TPR) repeat protein